MDFNLEYLPCLFIVCIFLFLLVVLVGGRKLRSKIALKIDRKPIPYKKIDGEKELFEPTPVYTENMNFSLKFGTKIVTVTNKRLIIGVSGSDIISTWINLWHPQLGDIPPYDGGILGAIYNWKIDKILLKVDKDLGDYLEIHYSGITKNLVFHPKAKEIYEMFSKPIN